MSEIKERPILMSAPMVRAILEGRKTQTRRIVKPQPKPAPMAGWWVDYDTPKEKHFSFAEDVCEHYFHEVACPYGNVYGDGSADRLWVRETWRDRMPGGCEPMKEMVEYAATPWPAEHDAGEIGKWRPSIFMPRWASRITLEITDIRIERLKDISNADAEAEGVEWDGSFVVMGPGHIKVPKGSPRSAFTRLWDSINGQGEENPKSWDANPFVWVIEFKRVTE
jgi:hypothetical protein